MKKKASTWIVGVDEVGRGPLAGPVCVGACAVKSENMTKFLLLFKGVRDSKQISAEKREYWTDLVKTYSGRKIVACKTSFVGHKIIDHKGIAYSIRLALRRSLAKLKVAPRSSEIFLDGALYAPKKYLSQKTIIKGDEKVPIISLASIVAKVARDERMKRLANIFPEYHLEINKGYGTRAHIKAIKTHGLSKIHRRTFTKNIAN